MVATIPQDAILGYVLAQAVALSASRQHSLAGRLWQRPFQETLLLLGAVFLPASYSFTHFWPDWSWMYLLDTTAASPAWTVLGYGGVVSLGVVGYLVARALLNAGRRRWVWGSVGGALLALGGVTVVAWDRFTHLGTHEEFFAGRAPALSEVGPFWAHLGVVTVFIAAGMALILWGHRRRPPPEEP